MKNGFSPFRRKITGNAFRGQNWVNFEQFYHQKWVEVGYQKEVKKVFSPFFTFSPRLAETGEKKHPPLYGGWFFTEEPFGRHLLTVGEKPFFTTSFFHLFSPLEFLEAIGTKK